MVEHMVMMKFSLETTAEQIEECINRASELGHHIPGIEDLVVGNNFSERSQGFQLGLTVRFVNREALDNYLPHPKHQEFVNYTMEIGRQDIIVVDFEI